MRNIWDDGSKNFTCNVCKKKMARRVMSPFLSFKPSSVDWVAEIYIPIYKDEEYRTGKIDVCSECYQKIAKAVDAILKN